MGVIVGTPQYSVLAPQQPDAYEDEADAEYLATQNSMAAGDASPESIARNQDMLQRGNGGVLREHVYSLRSAETPQVKNKMFQDALSAGDTEKAYQLMTTSVEPTAPNVVIEQGVAEEGMTHRLLTEEIKSKNDVSEEELSFSERMLIIGNFFLEMQKDMASYSNPEYVGLYR